MPLRFHRSIKIAPGIRMNFGKRGFGSISIGGLNIGKRGVYQNFNIPGTGITYRAQIVGSSAKEPAPEQPPQPGADQALNLRLNDDGSVAFLDPSGNPLSDQAAGQEKSQHRQAILDWLQQQQDQFNRDNDALINIHLTTPAPSGEIVVNPKPEAPALGDDGQALQEWEHAEQALRTDVEVMSAVLHNAFASIEWPRETTVSYEVAGGGKTVLLDTDLPEVEDMPTQEAVVNARELRLGYKPRTAAQIQLDYAKHIHGIAFRLVGDVFAHLPSVTTVVFSGYSQRADPKTGNVENQYLLSTRVPHDKWEKINFQNLKAIDVIACFEQFELRRDMTGRGVFSPIEPFDQ